MTTIIADIRDEPRIYADMHCQSCGVSWQMTKITQVFGNLLMGWAGTLQTGFRFATYLREVGFETLLKNPGKAQKFEFFNDEYEKDFIAVLLYRCLDSAPVIYQMYEDMVPVLISRPFHATGSGAHFALGAMMQGASALEALAIAAQLDQGTSSPFEALSFETNKISRYSENEVYQDA